MYSRVVLPLAKNEGIIRSVELGLPVPEEIRGPHEVKILPRTVRSFFDAVASQLFVVETVFFRSLK